MEPDRLPDPVIHLPLRLRRQLGFLVQTSADLRTLLNRVDALEANADRPLSARDEILLALVAARVLAPGDLPAQEALVEAFLHDALFIEVTYTPHGQLFLDPDWSFATLQFLAGDIKEAVAKRWGRTAGVIAVIVAGIFDSAAQQLLGDSIFFEDLGLRESGVEWVSEHPAPFGTAVIRIDVPGGPVYRVEFASSRDGVSKRVEASPEWSN